MQATNTSSTAVATKPAYDLITSLAHSGAGLAVIVACLEGGIVLQQRLSLPVPGNVLGMVLLLGLLQAGIVPDAWVRGPCTWLLLLLPALFVPIYVMPVSDPVFWSRYGKTLVPVAIAAFALTLGVTGWVAHRMRR